MQTSRYALLAALLAVSTPVYADDAPEPVLAEADADGAILAYPATFFDEFAPVNALDMVARLPGFSLSNGDTGRRGLADAFGNLLIDGERPSDKTLRLETILERIPANQVASIQLIREPLPEYDMRGFSQLANIILVEGAGTRSSFRARATYNNSTRLVGVFDGSVTRPVGAGELTLALRAEGWSPAFNRTSVFRDADFALTSVEHEQDQRRFREIEPSLSYTGPLGDNTTLRVNAGYEFGAWRRMVRAQEFEPDDQGALAHVANSQLDNDEFWEEMSFSSTLDHRFSDGLSTQSQLLLTRFETDYRPEQLVTNRIGAPQERVSIDFQSEREESAFRQSFDWTLSDAHSVEMGGEVALNAQDISLAIAEDNGDGVLTPVDLPVADTRVEELRAELFGNYVWVINDSLSVEGGLRYETSEITQSGDAEQERSFNYWKPRLSGTWRPGDQRRIRMSLERNVDQLDFDSFASSVDLNDDQVDVGNPDYRPQTDWTLEAEFEQRFNEDASLTLTLGRVWVQDLDDFIAITTPDGDVFDAPGNIGDGTLNRVTLEWTSPLGWLGLRNATLDGFLEWFDSDVEDPVTGVDRSWSGIAEWEARFDFRQTFPERQLAWGWDYFYLSDRAIFRASQFRNIEFASGDLDVYVETTRWLGLTTRLGADFVLDTSSRVERISYEGSRANNIIRARQSRRQDQGPQVYLQVRGAF